MPEKAFPIYIKDSVFIDPCCGSGGMFVQCSKFVKEHQGNVDDISIFGQESNPGTWKMAKMNLVIRGLEGNLGERNGDSFTDDLHKALRADFIIANPPYNLKQYWKTSLEGDPRWLFGRPDDKNGNYAWLSLMYAKLAPRGKAAILMPNGATTSNTQDDYRIRKAMIEQGKVEAILALPNKLFSNVSISVQCWILNRAKTDMIDLFARDILTHYEERKNFLNGKAMIVCQTRIAAVKLYRKIVDELRPNMKDQVILVVTESNKDTEEERELFKNSDYRKELGEEFKKDDSKYKIAIVCDMWLTGFDIPDLDVMYFIKRLKSYNLMQAIARVSRVYPGKFYGLIVDYIGLAKALDDALTEYTDRDRENNCQDVKKEIYNILKEKLSVLNEWFYKIDKSKFFSKEH